MRFPLQYSRQTIVINDLELNSPVHGGMTPTVHRYCVFQETPERSLHVAKELVIVMGTPDWEHS